MDEQKRLILLAVDVVDNEKGDQETDLSRVEEMKKPQMSMEGMSFQDLMRERNVQTRGRAEGTSREWRVQLLNGYGYCYCYCYCFCRQASPTQRDRI